MRKMYKKGIILSMCSMLVMCSMSGCDKGKVQYSSSEEQGVENNNEQVNSPNTKLAEALGVKDTWEETIPVDFAYAETIEINANVYVPETDSLKTVTAERIPISEEYKKNVAEVLSDGNIYAYGEDNLTKQEIQEQIENIEWFIENVSVEDTGEEYWNEEYAKKEALEQQLANASDDYTVTKDYSSKDYIIERDGIDYTLSIGNGEDGNLSYIRMEPKSAIDLVAQNEEYNWIYLECLDNRPYGTRDNEYTLKLEDVEEQAEKFLSELGIQGFKAVTNQDLVWSTDSGDSWCDGCHLVLYRFIDGVPVDGETYDKVTAFSVYTADEDFPGDISNYGLEKIEMDLNNKGVIRFWYSNPLEIKSSETIGVDVLSFESITPFIAEACAAYPDNLQTVKVLKYNTLELLYYRCKESDESSGFTIVPAWRLTYVDGQDITKCIMVNAMDGSFIDVGKDLYH